MQLEAAPPLTAIATEPPIPHLTIRPSRGWVAINFKELWQFRDLLVTLAGRDLKLRYKQTALGVIWVVLQPLLAAGVFSFVFGMVAKLPSSGIPYFVFSFAGLLGWNLFSSVLSKTTGCLVGNAHLISKVFFPRLILPLSSLGANFVDFAVAAVMMVVLLFIYQIVPSLMVLLLPVALMMLIAIALGIGLCTAALSVSYRDVQYIIPVFVQLLLYASPVAYSVSAVPEHLQWIYQLNPLTPPLELIRASLLGTDLPSVGPFMISVVFSVVILFVGLFSFKRLERKFSDIV